ncbi:MAG: hypothetical protein M1836_002781 [Candelina mexicana]|nr:MAG: hypothetical protein M1836_002781 [Candelina mexicana]
MSESRSSIAEHETESPLNDYLVSQSSAPNTSSDARRRTPETTFSHATQHADQDQLSLDRQQLGNKDGSDEQNDCDKKTDHENMSKLAHFSEAAHGCIEVDSSLPQHSKADQSADANGADEGPNRSAGNKLPQSKDSSGLTDQSTAIQQPLIEAENVVNVGKLPTTTIEQDSPGDSSYNDLSAAVTNFTLEIRQPNPTPSALEEAATYIQDDDAAHTVTATSQTNSDNETTSARSPVIRTQTLPGGAHNDLYHVEIAAEAVQHTETQNTITQSIEPIPDSTIRTSLSASSPNLTIPPVLGEQIELSADDSTAALTAALAAQARQEFEESMARAMALPFRERRAALEAVQAHRQEVYQGLRRPMPLLLCYACNEFRPARDFQHPRPGATLCIRHGVSWWMAENPDHGMIQNPVTGLWEPADMDSESQ